MLFQKMLINLLDQRVKAEIFAIVLSSHGEIDQRMAGSRGGHIEFVKEPERKRLADL